MTDTGNGPAGEFEQFPAGPISVKSDRVSALRRLANRSFREKTSRFLIEGPQAVGSAIAAGAPIVEVLVSADAVPRHDELLAAATSRGTMVMVVPEPVLVAVSGTVHPAGIVAVCGFLADPPAEPTDLPLSRSTRLAVTLVEANDPGNAGTIVRSADAAGADCVITTAGSVDIYNGKFVRATTGSLFHLPIATGADPLQVLQRARELGIATLAAASGGDHDLYSLARQGKLSVPVMWVFGNEARGLPAEVLAAVDRVVGIPMFGSAESLNVAGAAAVCLMTTAAAQRGLIP